MFFFTKKSIVLLLFILSQTIIAQSTLQTDDGSAEQSIGGFPGEMLWAKLFTPPAGDFPLNMTSVSVIWGRTDGQPTLFTTADAFDIYLYEDLDLTDTDLNTGPPITPIASILSVNPVTIDGLTYTTYNLASPVTFNNPSNIVVSIVGRTTTAGQFVASIDDSLDDGSSWVGFTNSGTFSASPVLPTEANNIWNLIAPACCQGNWTIRANYLSANTTDVPTLSEWGLIIFSLLLLNIGVVFLLLKRRKMSFEIA